MWEKKSDNSHNSIFEEVEQVFDLLPMYHMKILLLGFLMQN